MQSSSKIYLYKYLYILIMFLSVLALPFFFSTFENTYNKVVDEYNDAVKYAVSEEFSEASKEHVLELHAKVEEAKIKQRYMNFAVIMIISIFLCVFNFSYIIFGNRRKLLDKTPSLELIKKVLMLTSLVEIVYFRVVFIFMDNEYIGIHFWTLFFVNIIIVVFMVVLVLQIQYILKPQTKESLDF